MYRINWLYGRIFAGPSHCDLCARPCGFVSAVRRPPFLIHSRHYATKYDRRAMDYIHVTSDEFCYIISHACWIAERVLDLLRLNSAACSLMFSLHFSDFVFFSCLLLCATRPFEIGIYLLLGQLWLTIRPAHTHTGFVSLTQAHTSGYSFQVLFFHFHRIREDNLKCFFPSYSFSPNNKPNTKTDHTNYMAFGVSLARACTDSHIFRS